MEKNLKELSDFKNLITTCDSLFLT